MSIERLDKLAELYERGMLTREEFEKEKQKLLNTGDYTEPVQPAKSSTAEREPTTRANDTSTSTPSSTASKRTRLGKTLLGLGISFAIATIIVYRFLLTGDVKSVASTVMMLPYPVVVTQTAGESSESDIFDYVLRVSGQIQNTGATGWVIITTTMHQGGDTYERRDRRYMNADERIDVEYDFPEAEASSRQRYEIRAVAETNDNIR